MNRLLSELLELLRLERIEKNLFRGQSQDLGWGAIFGGQVLGQALSAAEQTIEGLQQVHSLHGYFLRQGDVQRPIVYDVDRIRDGRSFATRRVVAIQDGRAIFNLAASFQIPEEGFEHQAEMPDVPPPEGLQSDVDFARDHIEKIPELFRPVALAERPIEVRKVNPYHLLNPEVTAPKRCIWYRATDKLPDDPKIHNWLMAYASDFNFLTTALQPHGVSWLSPRMQVTSLDHAMWFHRPARMDEWMLHVIDSPRASGARGLVRGQFFTRDGTLVASTVQEGLMRRWPKS